eukprot:SAG22_NODE_4274_length_1320_cov_1.796069_1_plen_390_part_10
MDLGPFYVFLIESMLLYAICVAAHLIIAIELGDHYSIVITCLWFAFRSVVMLRRRRAHGYIRALGQPAASLFQPAKTEFPLPINETEECVEAFLFSRGAGGPDEKFHRWQKTLLGFGVIPRGCGCEGHHTLEVGTSHFRIDKQNGGGVVGKKTRSGKAGCLSTKELLVGPVQIINWVHVHKAGKSLQALLFGYVVTAVLTGFIAVFIAVLWPKCVNVDACDAVHSGLESARGGVVLQPGVVAKIDAAIDTGRCDLAVCSRPCEQAIDRCTVGVDECDFARNGVCDEPQLCPLGSDTLDCVPYMPSAGNANSTIENWIADLGLEPSQWWSVTGNMSGAASDVGADLESLQQNTRQEIDELILALTLNATAEARLRAALRDLQDSAPLPSGA